MVKTYRPVSFFQLERKMQAIRVSWLREECRKERTHVDQTKEVINHVLGDNTARTLGTIFPWHAKMASSGNRESFVVCSGFTC